MSQAEESLRRLADFVARLDRVDGGRRASRTSPRRWRLPKRQFKEAMEQDLNTAGALGAMFELVRMLNAAIDSSELGAGDVPVVKAAFDRFDRVLGVLALRRARGSTDRRCRPKRSIASSLRVRTRASAATSPKAIASGSSCSMPGSCSKTRPTGTRWKRK